MKDSIDSVLLPDAEVIRLLQAHLNEMERRIRILVDALESIRDHTAHNEYGSPAYAHRIAKSALEEAKV